MCLKANDSERERERERGGVGWCSERHCIDSWEVTENMYYTEFSQAVPARPSGKYYLKASYNLRN